MIPEYFMCEAEQVDNRGTVRGYYRLTQGYDCETLHLIHSIELGECEDYLVKPETVRKVAVKPRKSVSMEITGVCPNCSLAFIRKDNFCFHCGMAIDWSGAE